MQDAPPARPHLLARALVAGGLGLAASTLLVAPAQAAPCEGYSGVCAETPTDAPPTDNRPTPPAELEATGAEVALLSVVGLGALGGGAALVVAGRRRTHRGDAATA